MDVTDHLPQWGCPYCPQVLPSRNDLKKHLEPDKQLIINLLSQLRQALIPSCQHLQETIEGWTDSDGGNDVDLEQPTKRSHAEESWRCPYSDCEVKQVYSKKDSLLRHYKTHVACNVICECEKKFDRVDRFEKHVRDCQITQGYKGGVADYEKKYKQILGTRKVLTRMASETLDEQRTLTSQSEKVAESPSSNDTPNTTVQSLKRKRPHVELGVERLHRIGEREVSHQEDSMLEDSNSAVHLESLDSLNSLSNYTIVPPLPENTIGRNLLNHESNNFGHTRSSGTENNTENQSHDPAGVDWSQLYASNGTANQGQWDFGSMNDSAHHNSSLFNAPSGDGMDWNSLYATFLDINNVQDSGVLWTCAQGKATNI